MQAVQREFDLTQAPVEALTSMLQAYRKRADEPILAWAKRAQVARRQIIDAFLNAGGILWGEESARDALTENRQLDAMTAKALAYREVLRGTRGKLDIARRQRDEALSLCHETMAARDALKAEVERLRGKKAAPAVVCWCGQAKAAKAEVERLEADDSRARAALKQIIEISAGPIRRIAEEGLA